MTYSDGSKTCDLWFFCPLSACINHLHTSHNRDARTNQRAVFVTQLGRSTYRIAHSVEITSSVDIGKNKLIVNLYRRYRPAFIFVEKFMQVFAATTSFISLRSCKLSLKEINQFYGELNECKWQFVP
mgnify:FL=1